MTLAIPPDVTIQSVVGQPGFYQCDETHQGIFCPSRAVYRPCEKLLMSRDVIIEQDGLAGLALLVLHWPLFTAVRWPGMVALVVLLLLAVAIGHLLGGPHPDDRTALAIACATRHIGVAVVVATAFRGPRTMVLLAAYVVASAVVSIPYLQWCRRQARVEEPMVGGA